MFNKRNISKFIKLSETRGTHKLDDLSAVGASSPSPSQLVCDRGEMVSDIADMLNVTGIAVEIGPSFRPDHKGKIERAFRRSKEFPNV